MRSILFKRGAVLSFLVIIAIIPATAQFTFNNSISQYYRDGYLWNPALAGNKNTRLYALRNSAWSGFEGSSTLLSLAADVKLDSKMGVGIHLATYTSGIFKRYLGIVSYSYKITMNDADYFRIGGDLSLYEGRLNSKDIISGGQVDPEAVSFNEKGVRFNGDIGAYFKSNEFSMGASGYNLGALFKSSDQRESDLEIGQVLTSYKIRFPNDRLSLQPMVAYDIFYKSMNIFMVATQFQYQNVFHTSLYWKSNGSVMGGLGFMLKDIAEINFFYSSKNKYGYHDQYEIGLKYNIK